METVKAGLRKPGKMTEGTAVSFARIDIAILLELHAPPPGGKREGQRAGDKARGQKSTKYCGMVKRYQSTETNYYKIVTNGPALRERLVLCRQKGGRHGFFLEKWRFPPLAGAIIGPEKRGLAGVPKEK